MSEESTDPPAIYASWVRSDYADATDTKVARLWRSASEGDRAFWARLVRVLDTAKTALKRLADCDYNPDNPGEQTFEIASDALATITDADL